MNHQGLLTINWYDILFEFHTPKKYILGIFCSGQAQNNASNMDFTIQNKWGDIYKGAWGTFWGEYGRSGMCKPDNTCANKNNCWVTKNGSTYLKAWAIPVRKEQCVQLALDVSQCQWPIPNHMLMKCNPREMASYPSPRRHRRRHRCHRRQRQFQHQWLQRFMLLFPCVIQLHKRMQPPYIRARLCY